MLEPIPFWGMIEVDLPVKTYAGNTPHYIKEDMNNEPVAWMCKDTGRLSKSDFNGIPLYTHPVKELTDEEITELFNFYSENTYSHGRQLNYWIAFARAILRKAQEK
jgi:hypothetical protein